MKFLCLSFFLNNVGTLSNEFILIDGVIFVLRANIRANSLFIWTQFWQKIMFQVALDLRNPDILSSSHVNNITWFYCKEQLFLNELNILEVKQWQFFGTCPSQNLRFQLAVSNLRSFIFFHSVVYHSFYSHQKIWFGQKYFQFCV